MWKEGKGRHARCCEPVPTRVAAVTLSESRLAPIRGITIIRIATGINTAYYCHADRKLKQGTPTASSLPLPTHTHRGKHESTWKKTLKSSFFLIIVQKWFFLLWRLDGYLSCLLLNLIRFFFLISKLMSQKSLASACPLVIFPLSSVVIYCTKTCTALFIGSTNECVWSLGKEEPR